MVLWRGLAGGQRTRLVKFGPDVRGYADQGTPGLMRRLDWGRDDDFVTLSVFYLVGFSVS